MITRADGLSVIGVAQVIVEANLPQPILQCSNIFPKGAVFVERHRPAGCRHCAGRHHEPISPLDPTHEIVDQHWLRAENLLTGRTVIDAKNSELYEYLEPTAAEVPPARV